MSVSLKTDEEIAKMRIAGKLAADVLMMIGDFVKAGVTTEELDKRCHDYIVNVQHAIPAPLTFDDLTHQNNKHLQKPLQSDY